MDILQQAYNNNQMPNSPDDATTHICRLDGAIQQVQESQSYTADDKLAVNDFLDRCGYDGCDASGLAYAGFVF